MREFDDGSGQRTSSRRNVAVGLERSILVKACDLMWDQTIFVNRFPDPITLTEEVHRCSRHARSELGFPDSGDASLPSIEQVRYPKLITCVSSQTKQSGRRPLGFGSDQSTVRADLSICILQSVL